jgi:hypothetical protein
MLRDISQRFLGDTEEAFGQMPIQWPLVFFQSQIDSNVFPLLEFLCVPPKGAGDAQVLEDRGMKPMGKLAELIRQLDDLVLDDLQGRAGGGRQFRLN